MKKYLNTFIGVSSILVLLGAGCSSSSGVSGTSTAQDQKPVAPKMDMTAKTPPALTEAQKLQVIAGEVAHEPKTLTFDVHGGMFYFVPNAIKVKKGDKVKIVFHNDGGFHNFVLDEFNVKLNPINGGQTAEAEFTADKVGSFEFYCSVGQHRAMGQKGTLVVE